MALYESDVAVREVVTTGPEKARAVENDVRAKILDMLADEAMTVEGIGEELERRGESKAETTVRHHVDVLQDAEMVEIARLEDAGGGTRKYYRSNTRIFSYELPEGSGDRLDAAGETASREVASLIEALREDHGEAIESVAREIQPCEYCETQRYEEFVVRELVERALLEYYEGATGA